MIQLRKITKDNFDKVQNLNVAEHQKKFVSTITDSLAQAWLYYDTAYPFAVYAGDLLIGFVMLGYYESREQYTLWKFLLDEKYQNKGYGKQALQLAISYLHSEFDCEEIYTGVCIANYIAKRLYTSFGFEETGKVENEMEKLRYTFTKK